MKKVRVKSAGAIFLSSTLLMSVWFSSFSISKRSSILVHKKTDTGTFDFVVTKTALFFKVFNFSYCIQIRLYAVSFSTGFSVYVIHRFTFPWNNIFAYFFAWNRIFSIHYFSGWSSLNDNPYLLHLLGVYVEECGEVCYEISTNFRLLICLAKLTRLLYSAGHRPVFDSFQKRSKRKIIVIQLKFCVTTQKTRHFRLLYCTSYQYHINILLRFSRWKTRGKNFNIKE